MLHHHVSILILITLTSTEISTTSILSLLAYIMYCYYHLKSKIHKKTSQFLLRCYAAHFVFTLILLFFVTIAYDWKTGNGKYTILTNGHCVHIDFSTYSTPYFCNLIIGINKFLQITMFSAYLFYYYKFNMNVCAAQVTLQYDRELVKIAIAMGASVGLAYFIFIISAILDYPDIAFWVVVFSFSSNRS